MATLPARPDLGQLRRQAKDLLRAAQAGDATAAARIRAVSSRQALASAQLAVAREYGFASWRALKTAIEAAAMDLAQQAEAFCAASIGDWTGKAARMLAATPALAGHSFATAVVLGDATAVRRAIERDPDLATRTDPRTGWTALHAVCASRWHRLDPARADGLLAVARLLLDAGADSAARKGGRPGDWTPLRCAVAGAANPLITRLLLERGALPDDHDLYLAGFGGDARECLRLLLDHATAVPEMARMALSAPISTNYTEGVRMLLAAGADPRKYVHDDDAGNCPVVYAAVRADCAAELVQLLLAHGAEPDAACPDGLSPYTLATRTGRADLAALLRRYGASDDAADTDRFLAACLRADRAEAQGMLARSPSLADHLTAAQQATAMARAAQVGHDAAVSLMLDLGFPIDACGGEDGGTVLHAAAFSGSASTAALLIDRGADIEARDLSYHSTPLDWAVVGSGFQPADNPRPDWVTTVRILIEAGAATADITLDPDDPKPPSPDVADLLRGYGVGGERPDRGS